MFSFFRSKKWMYWAYPGGIALILLLVAQTYCSVLLNAWYRVFYDILQNVPDNTYQGFLTELWNFLYIVCPYVLIISITNFLGRLYALRWRECMSFDLVDKWIPLVNNIEGASQRIQQDTERFAKIVESIGLEIIRGIMVLIAFLPILWTLSSELNVPILGTFPGSLVVVSLIISLGGLIVSFKVGSRLPKLEVNNQVTEAAYRKNLVQGEDARWRVTPKGVRKLFYNLKRNHEKLFLHLTYFDLWAQMYGQCVVIVPYVIGGAGLFTGLLTLGMLVQISNCFSKVHESFNILLNRWTDVTELMSIHLRLKEFYSHLKKGV